jgi:hypothetical protein
MLDSTLAEYGWPSNTKNAARAGYVAAMRLMGGATTNPFSAPVEQAAQPVALSDTALLNWWVVWFAEQDDTSDEARASLAGFKAGARHAEQRLHPQRGSEPLTEERIRAEVGGSLESVTFGYLHGFARRIERAHGITSSNGEQA